MQKIFLITAYVTLATSAFGADKPLRACGSNSEQPPFSFYERKNGVDTSKVMGVTVDMLKALEPTLGQKVEVTLLPWRRCLAGLKSGDVDLAIDDRPGKNPTDEFLHSKAYFQLYPTYAFSVEAKTANFDVEKPGVLAQMKVCGLPGRQYDAFGIQESQVEYGTSSYKSAFDKLKAKRCDIFVEYREVIGGLFLVEPLMAKVIVDRAFLMKPLLNAKPVGLVFSVTSKSEALLNKLNVGIDAMQKKDKLSELLEPYFQ